MKPHTVSPIIALTLLFAIPGLQAQCGPSQIGPPCAFGGLASTGPAEPSISLGAGNPVNLATGNKYQQDIDLPPNPTAPGLELIRHYNSKDPRASVLGQGWALSYDTRLYRAGSAWQIVQADGSRLMFPDSGMSPEGSHISAHGRLDHVQGHHHWFWHTGTSAHFDHNGFLIALSWPHGESLHISRHEDEGPLHGTIRHVLNERGQQLLFHYSVDGQAARLTSVDTPLGTFHYSHDTSPKPATDQTVHRLTGVTRPDGMVQTYLYEASLQSGHAHALTGIEISAADTDRQPQRIGSWAYDAQGRAILSVGGPPDSTHNRLQLEYRQPPSQEYRGLTTITDGHGRQTHIQTATRGSRHVVTSVEGAGCHGCPAPGTQAEYDSRGRLTRVNGTRIDRTPGGRVRALHPMHSGWPDLSLHYDANGQRTHWHSTATGNEYIRYDTQGLPVERHFANGDTVSIEYDIQHRPLVMHERHGTQHITTRLEWHGHWLTRIEHPSETEIRHYDERGRITRRELMRDRANNGHHTHLQEAFTYDDWHRVVKHDLPEGGSLHYQWGDGPQITAIYWEDRHGHKHQVIAARPDQGGYFYGNGLHLRTIVDQSHRMRALQLHGPDRLIWSQELNYDSHQRIDTETIYADTGLTAAGESSWHYAYDHLSRLVGYQGERAAAAPSGTTWLAWDPGGAAAAIRHPAETTHSDIERDPSGLALRKGEYTLHYGAGRRLQKVLRDNQPVAQYRHNAFGYRIRRKGAGDEQTDYFYLDNRLVAQTDHPSRPVSEITPEGTQPSASAAAPNAAISRRYVYAHHVPVAIIDYSADTPQEQLLAVHADAQGAPRLITDAGQRVRWHAEYTPLGQARVVSGDIRMDLRLPGQVADPDTGWHDNLLRTYLPEWGHYLEPDPLGPIPGNQAFGYANQQPRRYADPMGLLLFAFDGTRHSADTRSNVWKMSQYYLDGRVHYHPGPGNSMFIDLDAITAHQATQILETQWKWLLLELSRPEATREITPIDILGFSRGAALARHFGNMIAQHTHQGLFQFSDPVFGAVSACVDLRFMGLFDTVAQFGIAGSRNRNYDLGIAAAWEWVAHAVALHEHRWLFPLTSAGTPLSHNVVEAPFIGAHADIGGGLVSVGQRVPDDPGDLSNVALNWMLWQARAASVPLDQVNPEDGTILKPIINDYRPAILRTIQRGDRRVDAPDGTRWLDYQDYHPRLGRETRQQTEPLIHREPGWESKTGTRAGVVDMDGYAQWLYEELGWRALPV